MRDCEICGKPVDLNCARLEYTLFDEANPFGVTMAVSHASCEGY